MNLKLDSNLKRAILLSLILNSALAFSGFYARAYDSYGHMFFASHYQKNWFDTWEPKWYMGFNVMSYPPLAHQVLALLGFVTGLESAYVIITLLLMVLLPVAIFSFSKVFISEQAAGYASLISAFLPGILISVYAWGQYTTIFSLVITLFTVPSFYRYITKGGRLYFAELICLFEATVATHHFTGLIFAPLLLFVTFVTILAKKERNSKIVFFKRLLWFIGVGFSLSLVIVYPVLYGAASQNVNIPHPTTLNYFQNLGLLQMFFINMFGFILLLIPLTVIVIRYRKDLLPVLILALFLLILGLGGTTPLPQIVFGANWLGLTYERFNLFSILTFAPLLGLVCVYVKSKRSGKSFLAIFLVLCILFSIWAADDAMLRPRPQEVPVESLVDFLNHDEHWRWRYMTLGFDSSDFCKLTIYSNATTLDGGYYRGRNISELANSGVDLLNNAKYLENGMLVLTSVLENASQYNLRFVFCNDRFYESILNQTGFTLLDTKFDQVTLWVKYDSPPINISQIVDTHHSPSILDYSWGIIPIAWLIGLLFINGFKILKKRKEYPPASSGGEYL